MGLFDKSSCGLGSGSFLRFVEEFIQRNVLPFYDEHSMVYFLTTFKR